MCLLVLAWQVHPHHRLIVAANRDEFHARPTAPLAAWPPPDEGIYAGRDLRAGGTWMAVARQGCFGAVTNFREPQRPRADAPSRGGLIPGFLHSASSPAVYLEALKEEAARYAGFNLLLADEGSLWYATNRTRPFARELPPGMYGVSNGLLDAPWPKLRRVKEGFSRWLAAGSEDVEALFRLLSDRTRAESPADLPLTGVSPAWEETLSAPFVVHPEYGTRASTVLLASSREQTLIERRFDAQGEPNGWTQLDLDA
jgi:uncharacterized protein with NRDE domain